MAEKENEIKKEENIETPKSEGKIGDILKEARLSQNKKIPDVSQVLCIRKAYLEAIENNDYEKIPEFPYGLGFIRSYADYLGLDSSLIIKKYKEETDTAEDDNTYYVPEPQAEATVPSKKYLLISLLAVMAIYFVWYFSGKNDAQTSENTVAEENVEVPMDEEYPLVVEDFSLENTAEEKADEPTDLNVIEAQPVEKSENAQVSVNEGNFVEENTKEQTKEENKDIKKDDVKKANVENKVVEEKVEEKTEEKNEKAEEKVVPAPGKSNIVFKFKKETWIEVKTADKLYISKVLNAGDSYALPKAHGLIVSVGRFDGFDTFIEGKQVDFLPKERKMNINVDEALAKLKEE